MVGTDLVLLFLPEIETTQNVTIPFHRELIEDSTDQGRLLRPDRQLMGARCRIDEPLQDSLTTWLRASSLSKVFGRKVSCQRRDEAGELPWIPNTPRADAFEENAHCFLVQVVQQGRLTSSATEDGADASTVLVDQFRFGQGIPGADALDQGERGLWRRLHGSDHPRFYKVNAEATVKGAQSTRLRTEPVSNDVGPSVLQPLGPSRPDRAIRHLMR
jgi:hypothetical protein